MRASQSLLSLALMVLFALVQHAEVVMGLFDRFESNCLTAFNLATSLGCYLLIRTGWNLRLAPQEPSLAMLQSSLALVALVWSYAITGPARGSILAIYVLALLFPSMFQLRASQSRLLALMAFLLLGAAMAWRSIGPAPRYDPRVEITHFAFAAIVLGGAFVLSSRFGRLRNRLSAQKAELQTALEMNRQLATRDALTGLLNRRAMVEILSQGRTRAPLGHGATCVALLDLDWFKRINDLHGHNAGDVVLCRVAELARTSFREGDALSRWGGEEFLLLLPNATLEEAGLALERMRRAVEAADFSDIASGLKVTFSAGATPLGGQDTVEAAVERADQALYRAKDRGRNRIELAPSPEVERSPGIGKVGGPPTLDRLLNPSTNHPHPA